MTTPQPLVSVIVNCYNGDRFLKRAIDSVIAQKWANWEIVFWDNQSNDASAAIVKSYDDARIRYYYAPKHTLLYEARNYACKEAKGDFLAFLDVDDWWLPEKLEKQLALFNDPEVGVVYGNFWIDYLHNGKRRIAAKKLMPEGFVLDKLLENYQVGMLTLMVRRSALSSTAISFDPRYHIIGDFDLVVRLAASHKIACVQDPVAVYQIHGKNESILRRSQHALELNQWCFEMTGHSVVGVSTSFCKIKILSQYIQAVDALLTFQKGKAIALFRQMPLGRLKIRLLVRILAPSQIIRMKKKVFCK